MSFEVPPDFEAVDCLGAETWDPDSEVYLLRVPKGSDISKLDGVKFSHSRVKQFGNENSAGSVNSVYELTPFMGQVLNEQPLLSVNGHVTVGPPLSGLLSVTKSYQETEPSSSEASGPSHLPGAEVYLPSNGPVPMPEGLRVRFTPFGSGQPVKCHHERKKKKGKKHHSRDSDVSLDFLKKRHVSDLSEELSQTEGSRSDSSSLRPESAGSKLKKHKKSLKLDQIQSDEVEAKGLEIYENHDMKQSSSDHLMFIDRTGSDRLPNSSHNGLAAPLSNGFEFKSHRKSVSSSDETNLNTSGVVSIGSGKKKSHKKNKRSISSSDDTSLNTSEKVNTGSEKKKTHRKDKRSRHTLNTTM